MSTVPHHLMTEAEYLAFERKSREKHSFYRGELFAMAGASREHNLIALNIGAELRQQLKNRHCEVYVGDMRVRVDRLGLYTYPDVVVVCGEPEFLDAEVDTLLNPVLLIEVLSESTEDYDRGMKFKQYRQLASLKVYLVVSQTEPLIEQFVRRGDTYWELSEVCGLDQKLSLSSIGCELPFAEAFAKVSFPPETQP